jgi:hemoglobin
VLNFVLPRARRFRAAAEEKMAETMFERYGGFASVSRVVSEFYDRALDSPVISGYFVKVDMKRLIDHQTKFIAQVMGGPVSFSNESLERVHKDLDITEAAFSEMAKLLGETLEDFDLEAADVDAILAEIMKRKNYVVARKA